MIDIGIESIFIFRLPGITIVRPKHRNPEILFYDLAAHEYLSIAAEIAKRCQ